MSRDNRLLLANLVQSEYWTTRSLLESAEEWMRIANLFPQKPSQKVYKIVVFMYLNRAMEIEAGLTISGK